MNREDILTDINKGIKNAETIRVFFDYEDNYYYFLPLKVNDEFFLGFEETDFILDGYSIRKIDDIESTSTRNDICNKILKAEGIISDVSIPDIDISNWESIFTDLKREGGNIIIEDEYNEDFFIGRIVEVGKDHLKFEIFDADGIWQDEIENIIYDDITSVGIHSRYVDVFSKYV